ncbi:phosphoribosylglycinamide formyltransferase [Thermoleophilia bacterium SCSIO 60948]|nr:phosphoribosylglycinamide formyltransferase [Thermoleophilia bacterium SCSIO 60948]
MTDGGDASAPDELRIAVLASGTGTNLQAILDGPHAEPDSGARVVAVASDKPGARALRRAAELGIETGVFPRSDFVDRAGRDDALADWIESRDVGLVVLAGYMQLLSPGFVERFRWRLINVHPALLPAFPGLDAIGQALAEGVRVTGVTVHFVDEGVDSGPIILQRAVPVPADRDRPTLEEGIHATEHALLPEAVRLFAAGAVRHETGSRVVEVGPA